MRVVIAGGGNVGTYIATELQQAGHEVLIVEVDPARVAQAQADGCRCRSLVAAQRSRSSPCLGRRSRSRSSPRTC